jgi:hypothetical protein
MSYQFSLFPVALAGPEGLRYANDFVSAAEEHDLIAEVAALPLKPFEFGQ